VRLITFRAGGQARVGVMRDDDELVEIDEPGDMLGLIESGAEGLAAARSALSSSRAKAHRLAAVELLSPIPLPRGNVIAIGRNYQKHAEESARKEGYEPQPPTIFTKAITSLTEPFADIAIDPAISDKIDWEAELALVIGKRGANIRRADARTYIFGYMALNDVTARDIQTGWGGQYFKGKSLDRTCPTGPWIVTADEIPDPQSLAVRLRLNGKLEQDGNTRDMIYPVEALIEWTSKGMTLLPGAIMATGTPDGVGFWRTPSESLEPGDVMETEVERVGKLRNRIVSAGRD
jgi:2-keto-4-pentenoate hydratase/2-oxohepta-3-ene-1,7-dioic acid hydratase in catechol pathway